MTAKAFDIDRAIALLRGAVAPFPKAAMFQLAEEGFDSLYGYSCISVDVHVHRVTNR